MHSESSRYLKNSLTRLRQCVFRKLYKVWYKIIVSETYGLVEVREHYKILHLFDEVMDVKRGIFRTQIHS